MASKELLNLGTNGSLAMEKKSRFWEEQSFDQTSLSIIFWDISTLCVMKKEQRLAGFGMVITNQIALFFRRGSIDKLMEQWCQLESICSSLVYLLKKRIP